LIHATPLPLHSFLTFCLVHAHGAKNKKARKSMNAFRALELLTGSNLKLLVDRSPFAHSAAVGGLGPEATTTCADGHHEHDRSYHTQAATVSSGDEMTSISPGSRPTRRLVRDVSRSALRSASD
jgi:hypothetical protein